MRLIFLADAFGGQPTMEPGLGLSSAMSIPGRAGRIQIIDMTPHIWCAKELDMIKISL